MKERVNTFCVLFFFFAHRRIYLWLTHFRTKHNVYDNTGKSLVDSQG